MPCVAGCQLQARPVISEAGFFWSILRGCVIDEVWQDEQVMQEWLLSTQLLSREKSWSVAKILTTNLASFP